MYKIFEFEYKDSYYVKLESKHNSQLRSGLITELSLFESLTSGSPVMSMKMLDEFGDLITHNYISPDSSYDLYLGKDLMTSKKSSFSLSKIEAENHVYGKTMDVGLDMTFISSVWPKLMKNTKSRSWTNVRYSDVVQELAEEVGFEDYDIETTNGVVNVIQPDWTNLQLLGWLRKQAVNSDNIPGYEFGSRLDGKMFFKTYNKLYETKPIRDLILADETVDTQKTFGNMNMKQDYAAVLSKGGFGLNSSYFDWENKKYVTEKKRISDSEQSQVADWWFISEAHEDGEKRFYGGRDTNTPQVAENKIADVANSVQSLEITISGDIDLHVGDVINLIIPTDSESSNKHINDWYSGYWMIGKLAHNITFENNVFSTYLTLIRSGINGIDVNGLVKSKAGKVIK